MTEKSSLLHGEELSRSIGPEINNALAVILGNTQLLLLKNAVNSEGLSNIKAIERSSFRIQLLVEKMVRNGG